MKTHHTITPKAAKLLQRVAKRILKHHEEYNQNCNGHNCGCIAHHICKVAKPNLITPSSNVMWRGAELLGFNYLQSPNLFATHFSWPKKFKFEYANARTSKGRARVGYRRIMHYLKTGE